MSGCPEAITAAFLYGYHLYDLSAEALESEIDVLSK